jgi:polyferredoxin
MNSAFKVIDWIYRKLGLSRLKVPRFLDNRVVRIAFLLLFIASMVLNMKLGLKLNILLYLILFSVLLTLLFEEVFWHRRLCPFGTILSLSSRKAPFALRIDQDACIKCGKCQGVCPSSSIETLGNGKRTNIGHECLLCGNCIDVCPPSVCATGWSS